MHGQVPARQDSASFEGVPEACATLIENSVDALSWHGPDGAFRYVSPGFTQLLGWREAELLGQTPQTLVHPDDVFQVVRAFRDLPYNGSFRLTFRIRRSDHTYVWVESTGRVTTDGDGSIVAATRDIEVRRSLLESLDYEQRALAELERLAEQQYQFVNTVAHRARTPMTSVLGFAQLLQRAGAQLDDARRQHVTDRLVANAESLAEIVQEATELDGQVRTRDPIQRDPCDLPRLIDAALAHLTDGAAPITVDLDPRAAVIQADAVRLDRALRALLRNAIAHTPVGTPVTIRTLRDGDRVTITIEDRGPGIRDDLKQAIFEPFTRGDAELPHNPGIGLGLSLVARIAAEHDGRAWVSDAAGGGAAFHLDIAA